MRYRGGGLGSAPSPVWREDEWRQTHTENTRKHTHTRAPSPTYNQDTTLPEQSDRPAALFVTTLDERAPEEQVVHNVIPLKDKMPRPGFSDVHGKAKRGLTVTFVRCQSDASHTDVRLFTEDASATHSPKTHLWAGWRWKDRGALFFGVVSCCRSQPSRENTGLHTCSLFMFFLHL